MLTAASRVAIAIRPHRWGFKELGQGFFSRVFAHPNDPNKVFKIGPLDDGWLFYAAFCQQHEGKSPYLLKVHKVVRFQRLGLYLAVIERCEELVFDIDELDCKWRSSINPGFCSDDLWAMEALDEVFPSLSETLVNLCDYAASNGLSRDLHGKNAMLRADGSLCITDPFSFT